jgi:hypothetical protein
MQQPVNSICNFKKQWEESGKISSTLFMFVLLIKTNTQKKTRQIRTL